jgi:hypothetical protein
VGAVSVYLDVNVIVALFVLDPLNERADKAMHGLHDSFFVLTICGTGTCNNSTMPWL